jgi:hypothetical protein
MRNPLSIIFFIVGIILLMLGVIASESLASSFSKLFTGEPTDRAILMIIGGVVAIVIGSVLGWNRSRT